MTTREPTTAMRQYALSAALAGVVALGAMAGWPLQAEAASQISRYQVSQYCVPPEQDPNSHRIYCGTGQG